MRTLVRPLNQDPTARTRLRPLRFLLSRFSSPIASLDHRGGTRIFSSVRSLDTSSEDFARLAVVLTDAAGHTLHIAALLATENTAVFRDIVDVNAAASNIVASLVDKVANADEMAIALGVGTGDKEVVAASSPRQYGFHEVSPMEGTYC